MHAVNQCQVVKRSINELVILINAKKKVNQGKEPSQVFNSFLCILAVDNLSAEVKPSQMIKIHPIQVELDFKKNGKYGFEET